MEEGTENNDFEKEEIFSKAVRAGKRTYFLDVKNTRKNELYLTITESKKRYTDDGKPIYDKHKVFLYKEDLEKFEEGLAEVIAYIRANSPSIESRVYDEKPQYTKEIKSENTAPKSDSSFTDINFEDLDK